MYVHEYLFFIVYNGLLLHYLELDPILKQRGLRFKLDRFM